MAHACEICPRAFSRPSDLARHTRVHTGEKPFRCEECEEAFALQGTLTTHTRRRHTGERPFRCKECGDAFAQQWTLTGHLRRHTGEKPFRCEECGERFALKGSLTSHIRRHTGERPFRCKECGDTFAHTSALTRHASVHTGKKPFECKECGEAFAQQGTLARHLRYHTGEKPYVCTECGAGFTQKGNRDQHLKAIHTAAGQQRQKKKEAALARFLDTTGFRYEREVTVQFCGEGNKRLARVDFILYRPWGVVILECDEYAHEHYPAQCEAARMMDIFAEQVKQGRLDKIRFIRFNPDPYTENGKRAKTAMKDRYEALRLAIVEEPEKHLSVRYLFYSASSPLPEVCLDPGYPRELRELVDLEPPQGRKRSAADAGL